MVKHPPINSGDTGWIPGPGRSHKPQSNEACALPQLLSPHSRACAPHLESSPGFSQLKKSPCRNEDPVQTKIK